MTTLTSETLPVEERTSFRDYLPEHDKTRPYPAEMEMFLRFLLIPAWILTAGLVLFTVRDAGTLGLFFGIGGVVLAAQFLRTKNPTGKFLRTVVYLSTFLAVGTVVFLIARFVDASTTPVSGLFSYLTDFLYLMKTMVAAILGVTLSALTFAWSSVRTHNNRIA